MRRPVNEERLHAFMRELGAEARRETRLYFTGGATALLMGWRDTTVDLDIRVFPEDDALFRAIPRLKESLEINVELASPLDFIPELPGWRERSRFIAREGKLSFYHFDFYAQALSKLQRAHVKDFADVESMHRSGLIEARKLFELFEAIEDEVHRFPAIDPSAFRRRVREFVDAHPGG